MKTEKTSRRSPAPTRATPAKDSTSSLVKFPLPPKVPAGLVKLKGKVPVKFPVKLPPVRVKVVPVNVKEVPDGDAPVTSLREGLPMTTRTRPTAIRTTLPITSLLTKILQDL